MRELEGKIESHLYFALEKTTKREIASSEPALVETFDDLIRKVATLSFLNKDFLLFFRGQKSDHLNASGNSSFYPSIYRTNDGEKLSQNLKDTRFRLLDQASSLLIKYFEKDKIDSLTELKKRKLIQWSILQHYEVCDTPLLDLTQSLRVACSFALEKASDFGFVFVFGLPYITNRISMNSEQELVNIRLLSICPPQALRPYYQEACLVGTVDVSDDYSERSDLDFKRRLIAKFKIANTDTFWGGQRSLAEFFMPKNDRINEICIEIRHQLKEQNNIEAMFPGRWLNEWQAKDGRSGWEILEVKNGNQYHAFGRHMFDLDSVLVDKANAVIKFRKVGIGDDRRAFNTLRIINQDRYEGIEANGTKISYTREK